MIPTQRNTNFGDPQGPKILEIIGARYRAHAARNFIKIPKKKVDEESAGEYGPSTSSIGSQNVFPL